jgi:glutamate synthase (ferredoxin)
MYHALVGRGPTIADADAFERKLYVIRKRFETEIEESGLDDSKYFYFASLSSPTLVYKGMLTPDQLGAYFADDFDDERSSAPCAWSTRGSAPTRSRAGSWRTRTG